MQGPRSDAIDIGHDHFIKTFFWQPDDLPANRALYNVPDGVPMPRVDPAGILVHHRAADGSWCMSAAHFDMPGLPPSVKVRWQVVQAEPLTLDPSLECLRCGDHGHIRDGRWVPA